MTIDDLKGADPGTWPGNGPARFEYVVTAAPRLQITIAVLETIASCGAELVSLQINKAGALHRYELVVMQLPFEAAADLTARIASLEGVARAMLERWRWDFERD